MPTHRGTRAKMPWPRKPPHRRRRETTATRAAEYRGSASTANSKSNMYRRAKTWNPFRGCGFHCTYCGTSFQLQAKRLLHNCGLCYAFVPHFHPERLGRIPPAPIVFVCGNGDLAFASSEQQATIIATISD